MVEPYLTYSQGLYKVFVRSLATRHIFLVGAYERFWQAANAVYHIQELSKDSIPF